MRKLTREVVKWYHDTRYGAISQQIKFLAEYQHLSSPISKIESFMSQKYWPLYVTYTSLIDKN